AVHQTCAGVWGGGLVCALLLAQGAHSSDVGWLRRFSAVASVAVAGLAVTGIVLSLTYIATPGAAIGTSYGAMVLAKLVIFAALVAMGALNHRALHGGIALWRGARTRPRGAPPPGGVVGAGALLVRRRLEVESGLAVVAMLLAASIASAPPA